MKTYLERIRKLSGCLIENPVDLYYLTGLQLSLGVLVIGKKTELFVDGRYIEYAKKHSPVPVSLLSTLKSLPAVGFDSSTTTVDRFETLKKLSSQLIPLHSPLKEIRAVKEKSEITAMKKSAALLWKGFTYIKKQLRVGVTEKEIALKFEIFCRQHGAEKLAFDPIIAFGRNSAYPHYRAGNARLKKGDVVLIDIGVVVDKYHSDMTRTLFFGKADPRLVLLESVVKEAHAAALKICKSGTKVGDLDGAARKVIKKADLEELIQHSLGHGIGLETHEFPRIKYRGADHDVVLQENMVITIEPGLYLPGVGGIRHEDTIVVEKKGYTNFYA